MNGSQIIELIQSNRRSSFVREGLVIAYTPGPGNKEEPGTYRVAVSREKKYPTWREVDAVEECIRQALHQTGRLYRKMIVEPYLRRDKWWYHVIEWQEYKQESLFLEGVSDESRPIYA